MTTIITRDDIEPEEPEKRQSEGGYQKPDDNVEGYQVGYGQPPLHSQFQPGNKRGKGRSKGSKNLKTMVNQALGQKASAKVDGEVKKITKIELALHQLANQAAGGNLKAIESSIGLYDRHGPQEDPAGPSREQTRANLTVPRDYLALWDLFSDDEGGPDA